MANVSRIRGFVPAKSLIGAPWSSMIRQYPTDAAKSLGIFIGDAVTLDTDGNVIAAVSGGAVLGVCVAIGKDTTTFGETGYFDADNLGKRYIAAAEAGIVGVVPAEAATFLCFDDGTDLDLALGDTADLDVGAGGSTTTGNSTHSITTSSNADVKVVEMVTAPNNDPALADAQYIVKFVTTEHSF